MHLISMGGPWCIVLGDLESLMYSLWRIWSEQWISYWHFEKLGNQIDRPRMLRREKREDENRNRRGGGVECSKPIWSKWNCSCFGARRRRGVKSKAFLRQENPSETVAALVQEGGSVLVDGKLGSGWALWPRPCCSPSLSHKSVAVLWFSSWASKCCGFHKECCSVVLVHLAVIECCNVVSLL